MSEKQRQGILASVRRRRKKGQSVEGYRRGTEGAPRGPSPYAGNPPVRRVVPRTLAGPDQQDRSRAKVEERQYEELFKEYQRRKRRKRPIPPPTSMEV